MRRHRHRAGEHERSGIENLLSDTNGMSCPEAFNCESLSDVLGGSAPETLDDALGSSVPADFPGRFISPAGWQDSLYGPYDAAKYDQYYYYNTGDNVSCDSPRLATVPIVAYDDNWALNGAPTSWPNGSNKQKMIGFYTVYIDEPNGLSDFDHGGNGNGKGNGGNGLDQVQASVIWFGPDATHTNGSAFAPLGSIDVPSGVKLISG